VKDVAMVLGEVSDGAGISKQLAEIATQEDVLSRVQHRKKEDYSPSECDKVT
jgi:hypothetical protein